MIQKEGFLIQSSLVTGLNALRKATVNDPKNCYTAFFELSIAIERLMKVILILDHFAENGFAASLDVKKYFHDLKSLYQAVSKIASKYDGIRLADLQSLPISRQLFDLLSDFAKGDRYHNINELTASGTSTDPLTVWRHVLGEIVKQDLRVKTKIQAKRAAEFLGLVLESSARVLMYDLDNSPLTASQSIEIPMLQSKATRYAVWHVISVVAPLADLLNAVSDQARKREIGESLSVPFMSEFLQFVHCKKSYVLRRGRWT